jgi:hypothetical protein
MDPVAALALGAVEREVGLLDLARLLMVPLKETMAGALSRIGRAVT